MTTLLPSISPETLVQILDAYLFAEMRKGDAISQRVRELLEIPQEPTTPDEEASIARLRQVFVRSIVKRLLAEKNDQPFFTTNDLVAQIIDEVTQHCEASNVLSDRERTFLQTTLEPTVSPYHDLFLTIGDEHPYDFYWRLIRAVISLADEQRSVARDFSYIDLLSDQDLNDELMRRLWTRTRFEQRTEWQLSCLTNLDLMRSLALSVPFALCFGDPDAIKYVEDEAEQDIMPKLRAVIEPLHSFARSRSATEIDRIYGTPS